MAASMVPHIVKVGHLEENKFTRTLQQTVILADIFF